MNENISDKLLEKLAFPNDLKELTEDEQYKLCDEIRDTIIEVVSNNGGHLSSNLGVVELTVALTNAFNLPSDTIVWDVGHQTYPYKILTGRYKDFFSIRKEDGITGFPCREESEYDILTSGHSSTSISAALGISEANHLQGKDDHVVAVIGDGALSGGLAYEGLNNAGRLHRNFIVILNDNEMSISKNVGSMARYLTQMRIRPRYINIKRSVESSLNKVPIIGRGLAKILRIIKDKIKKILYPSTLFEDFGFEYYGPIDGHDIKALTDTLNGAKLINKPVIIHVATDKGKGYEYAEQSPSVYHGLSGFDVETGATDSSKISFSDVFGEKLDRMADNNDKICAITAAMQDGTGLNEFRKNHNDRFYDVGIAEEHALTFAGGLAAKGMIPVFAVYSTFLQRAYDELIHDIAMQKTKAIIAIDRAGIVGEDGKTHQGLLDAAFLQSVSSITVYSPCYFSELEMQLEHLIDDVDTLSAIRYPRGIELYKPKYFSATNNPFDVYGDENAEITIVTYGRLFSFAAEAKYSLEAEGKTVKIVKLNQIVPIDGKVFDSILDDKNVFFFEEGIKTGGIGEHFSYELYSRHFAGDFILKAIDTPFIDHAPMYRTLEKLGLNKDGMIKTINDFLESSKV